MNNLPNHKARVIFRSSSYRTAYFFLQVVVSLAMTPFIIRSLGDRMYGLWMIIGSALGFYWVLDLGLDSATQRFLSRATGNSDKDEVNAIINTSLYLFSCVSALVAIITAISAVLAPYFIRVQADALLVRSIIGILGFSLAIRFPASVYSSILISHLRYDILTAISTTKLIVRSGLVLLYLSNEYGILALSIISCATDLLEYFLIYRASTRIATEISYSSKYISKKQAGKLFSFSAFTFIAKIADNLKFNMDNFVIGGFLGLQYVAVYSIASRLVQYFMALMTSAFGNMMPVFSQYEGVFNYVAIREKYLFLTKLCSMLSLLVGSGIAFYGRDFILRWLGEEYLKAYSIMLILIVGSILAYLQGPAVGLLIGISKHRIYAILNIVEGVLNLVLSLVLVQRYGLYGVAIGTAVPMVLIKLFIMPYFVCRAIQLDPLEFYRSAMIPVIAKSSLVLCAYWLVVRSFLAPTYLRLSILGVAHFLFLGVTFYFLFFNSRERIYLRNVILSPLLSKSGKS